MENRIGENTKPLNPHISLMSEPKWVPFNILEPFVVDVFKSIGLPPEDAYTCMKILLDADRKGLDTHGVTRLKPVYYDARGSHLERSSPTRAPGRSKNV